MPACDHHVIAIAVIGDEDAMLMRPAPSPVTSASQGSSCWRRSWAANASIDGAYSNHSNLTSTPAS